MTDVPLHFPLEEYHRRIALARQAMAAKGLDLILVSDPSNMSWLTGYDGWSFYVHQGVLLGARGRARVVGPRHGCAGGEAHRVHAPRQHRGL